MLNDLVMGSGRSGMTREQEQPWRARVAHRHPHGQRHVDRGTASTFAVADGTVEVVGGGRNHVANALSPACVGDACPR